MAPCVSGKSELSWQVHIMLTAQQLDEFRRSGIVRVPGAISVRAAASMCDSVWDMMSRNYKIRRDYPKTWLAQRIMGTKERPKAITVAQVVNPPLRAILDQILAPEKWDCDQHWGSLLVSFPGTFPEAPDGWDLPHAGWHFDAPMVRALPDLYGVRMFACLAEVATRGGATLALAGSPRLAHALANARGLAKMRSADLRDGLRQRYEWINELCSYDLSVDRVERFMKQGTILEDVEVRVVEMTGAPGDVYLVHPLMMHAASPNCLATPRIVLSSTVYQRGVDWSALYGPEREAAA
jgi:hypothetical protein